MPTATNFIEVILLKSNVLNARALIAIYSVSSNPDSGLLSNGAVLANLLFSYADGSPRSLDKERSERFDCLNRCECYHPLTMFPIELSGVP